MTDGTVQALRHSAVEDVTAAKTALSGVPALLQGARGYSKEEQTSRLESAVDLVDEAIEALREASESLGEALSVVDGRADEKETEVESSGSTVAGIDVQALAAAIAAALKG